MSGHWRSDVSEETLLQRGGPQDGRVFNQSPRESVMPAPANDDEFAEYRAYL